MRSAQRAVKQHVIPEFYLGRFSIDGVVLMTDKRSDERKSVSVGSVMTIRDFYTVETQDGPSDAMEKALGTIEGAAAAVLRRIDGGLFPLREADRDLLATYIGFQLLRGQEFRSLLHDAAHAITEQLAMGVAHNESAMRQALTAITGAEPGRAEIRKHQDLMRSALEEKRIKTTVPTTYAVQEMIALVEPVASVLAQRSWTALRSDVPGFITTDAPVTLWSRPFPDGRPMPVGVGTAQEIIFPLDPRTALLLGRPNEPSQVYAVTPKFVRVVNERAHLYAKRFTFQHPSGGFVFDEALARAPD